LAREAIIEACAELVAEHRHLDFAMKDVAERAGVSLRTVYNHFATREDLLDALGDRFDEQMAALGAPSAGDLGERMDIGQAVAGNLRIFEAMGGISDAFAQMPLADVGRDEDRAERTRLIVEHISGLMPELPRADATAIAVVLRHLLSHRSWFWLTREYGLTTEQVAVLVPWTVSTLVDAANRGEAPTAPEEPGTPPPSPSTTPARSTLHSSAPKSPDWPGSAPPGSTCPTASCSRSGCATRGPTARHRTGCAPPSPTRATHSAIAWLSARRPPGRTARPMPTPAPPRPCSTSPAPTTY
jgi:AcrR family transcriptional regulator